MDCIVDSLWPLGSKDMFSCNSCKIELELVLSGNKGNITIIFSAYICQGFIGICLVYHLSH